jgi:hypothetical protein
VTRLLALLALLLGLAGGVARADDAVALLPLDADKSLEIYGQPVASEIARALVAGKLDVVVVGPKAGVPERARIVVDGRIAGDKADNVVITVRVRDRFDGTVLASLTSTAPLENIDRAASDISSRLLPSVVAILDKLDHPAQPDPHRPPPVAMAPPTPRVVLISMIADAPFKAPLAAAIAAWAGEHHRVVQEASALGPDTAANAIEKAGAELGIAFEVDRYLPEGGMVDMARARVRVRISTARGVAFDRVVVTDTVIGERKITEAELAGRVAREVLAIIAPHLHRAVPSW